MTLKIMCTYAHYVTLGSCCEMAKNHKVTDIEKFPDYRKTAQILSLSSRLMSNKARFVNKIVSGRAPIYLSTKLLINQSSRNSSRKLNVPIPRIELFKSILIYSGPAPFWNLLPSELRLPVSPSVFKKRLTLHMFSLLGDT